LATGDDALRHHRRYQMDIETGGRQFTAYKRDGRDTGFEVSDDVTGELLIGFRFTDFGSSGRGRGEVATVDLASTAAKLSWNHLPAAGQLGFYETTGAPVLVISHRLDLQPSADHGVARTLLRFWGSVVRGADRYQIEVTDQAVGRLLSPQDLVILALLGVHLERTYNRRHGYDER
jgi:hypothetical protein